MTKIQSPSVQKNLRNEKIFLQIACCVGKEEICKKYDISLRQLNRILAEANEEAEEWYKLLPRKTMIQIFRNNCGNIFQEIERLINIRNKVASQDQKLEFQMTREIISAYCQYTKLVSDGPSLIRQKEVVSAAEKLVNNTNGD